MPPLLQLVDSALTGAGALTVVAVCVWLAWSGRWRNPLANVPPPAERGLPGAVVAAVLCAYLLVHVVAQGLATPLAGLDAATDTRPAAPAPGTHAWHVLQTVENLANVLAVGLMVLVRSQATRLFPRTPRPAVRSVPGDDTSGAGGAPAGAATVATPVVVDMGPAPGVEAADHGDSSAPEEGVGLGRGILLSLAGLLVILPVVAIQLRAGVVLWELVRPGVEAPLHPVLIGTRDSAWGAAGLVQLVIGAVLVAPLTEEVLFRGVVLEALCRYTGLAWVSILASAVAFGFLHAQPQDILPLISMGVILGYIRIVGRALWPCVVIHMLFNARTMAAALLLPEGAT